MMATTEFMELDIPNVGTDTNYWTRLIDCYNRIDSHDHLDIGNQLSQAGVAWNTANLIENYVLNVNQLNFVITSLSLITNLYCEGNDLFFTDSNLNQIRITLYGAINYNAGVAGFTGDFRQFNASVYYTSSDQNYEFNGGINGTNLYSQKFGISSTAIADYVTCDITVTSTFNGWVPVGATFFQYDDIYDRLAYFDADGLLDYAAIGTSFTDENAFLADNRANLIAYLDVGNAEIYTSSPGASNIAITVSVGSIWDGRYNFYDQRFLGSTRYIDDVITSTGNMYIANVIITPAFSLNYGTVYWQLPFGTPFKPFTPVLVSHTILFTDGSSNHYVLAYRELINKQIGYLNGYFKVLVGDQNNTPVTNYTIVVNILYTYQES